MSEGKRKRRRSCHCIESRIIFKNHSKPRKTLRSTCKSVNILRAKKVVPDSPGLVDFAIGLVNAVINLSDGQVKFFEEFKLQKNCEINLLIKTFLGLVEILFGLVNVSLSLPEWQAVKMTFFAPCYHKPVYRPYTWRPSDPDAKYQLAKFRHAQKAKFRHYFSLSLLPSIFAFLASFLFLLLGI